MTRAIRLFLLVEAAVFLTASLVHAGALVGGYEHREATIAERVIGITLLAGLAVSWIRPAWTRAAALAAQGFALVGTSVGIVMIAIGVGPRSAPDVAYHAAIVGLLLWGLAVAARGRPPATVRT